VLLGQAAGAGARALLEAVGRAPADDRRAAVLVAASPLPGGAILRLAARSVEEGMAFLRPHLSFVADRLDGDPLLRRP
jgi:urease accessory protein